MRGRRWGSHYYLPNSFHQFQLSALQSLFERRSAESSSAWRSRFSSQVRSHFLHLAISQLLSPAGSKSDLGSHPALDYHSSAYNEEMRDYLILSSRLQDISVQLIANPKTCLSHQIIHHGFDSWNESTMFSY
jgi:hypothetical protein